jgi:CheY-like chemotaxis protein
VVDSRTVLVVDDEPDVLLLCRVNLEFEGYRGRRGRDGEQALERLARTPGRGAARRDDAEDGRLAGARAIKADPGPQGGPVVMLTAKVQDQDQIRGWSAGRGGLHHQAVLPLALSQVLQDVLDTDPEEEERRRQLVLEKLQLLRDAEPRRGRRA